jgi:hypothetical protein
MRSFEDISMGVLCVLCILFAVELYYLHIRQPVVHKYDDHEPLTKGEFRQHTQHKQCPSKKEIFRSSVCGALRGSITGALIGGTEGAICGAIVMAIINPLITGVEHLI